MLPVLSAIVSNDPADRLSRLALATNYRMLREFAQAEATLEPLSDSDADARVIRVQIAMDRADFDAAVNLRRMDPPTMHGSILCEAAWPCTPAIHKRPPRSSEPHSTKTRGSRRDPWPGSRPSEDRRPAAPTNILGKPPFLTA